MRERKKLNVSMTIKWTINYQQLSAFLKLLNSVKNRDRKSQVMIKVKIHLLVFLSLHDDNNIAIGVHYLLLLNCYC